MFAVLAVVTDANGGDVNDDKRRLGVANNRQRCNARFVFSSFVNLADLGRLP